VQLRNRFLVEPRLQQAGERMDRMASLQAEIECVLVPVAAPSAKK